MFAGTENQVVAGNDSTQFTLSGLAAFTQYTIYMVSYNPLGGSYPSGSVVESTQETGTLVHK